MILGWLANMFILDTSVGNRNFIDAISVGQNPSITDGVHRKENFVKIIPVFSTFSKFFKKEK